MRIYANMRVMQELKAKVREELGRAVKPLRKAGFMPAVVYGEGIKTQSITVPLKDFQKMHKQAGESTLIKLEVANGNSPKAQEYNVLIHDIKNDPIKGHPLHADFLAVRMDKLIRTKVPVECTGGSGAVKSESGI